METRVSSGRPSSKRKKLLVDLIGDGSFEVLKTLAGRQKSGMLP